MSDPATNPKAKPAKPGLPTSPEATIEAAQDTAREAAAPFVVMLDRGLSQARETHERMSEVFGNTSEALEEAFSNANRGSAEYRAKLMDIARANTSEVFEMMRELMGAKSLPELLEVSTTHTRRQLEMASAQMRELTELTQKVATETTGPLRQGMTEQMRRAG
jgi:phasin